MIDTQRFLDHLTSSSGYDSQVSHIRSIPAREAAYGDLETPLAEPVAEALRSKGIERLYTHQVDAIEAIRAEKDVVVVTGTASGKTLCYNIPFLERLLKEPGATALFIYPTKALAQDQLRGLGELRNASESLNYTAGTYDGDTSPDLRRSLRDNGNIILTNPDMLHQGILPNHSRWGRFFTNLRMVVIDEVHTYRGVFGSNVANVMRRLNRVAAHYGARPTFVCCSATIANPAEHAGNISGRAMQLIDNDGAPRGPRKVVLWNPPLLTGTESERRSPNTEAKELLAQLVKERIQTITFVRTRLSAELILRYCQDTLDKISPRLAKSVQAYRGGYLPDERRAIERKLASGELLGVTSTNALELGIDIGGLDAAIIVGFPGTIASLWQQAGRAGRSGEEALVILIGFNSPVDQYFMRHPESLLGRAVENAIINPDNPHISVGHIRSALYELPLTEKEHNLFGEYTRAIIEGILYDNEEAREQLGRYYWKGQGFPAADVNLRVMDDIIYTIVDTANKNRTVGTVDEVGAFHELHTHAVYLHEGVMYFVNELDVNKKIANVEPRELEYFTQAVAEEALRVDEVEEKTRWRISEVQLGDVTVESLVVMFKKVRFETRESIGYENVDLPTRELPTHAFWVIPPASARKAVKAHGRVVEEGMVGIANVMREVIPSFVMCDTGDIGAVVDSANLGASAIFIYDRYEHGIGFAERAYGMVEEIMQRCLDVVTDCPCHQGCPSCVGSATPARAAGPLESSTRERLPDKETSLILLHDMLELPPYEPKFPARSAPGSPGTGDTLERREVPKELPPPSPLPANLEKKIRKRVQKFKRGSE